MWFQRDERRSEGHYFDVSKVGLARKCVERNVAAMAVGDDPLLEPAVVSREGAKVVPKSIGGSESGRLAVVASPAESDDSSVGVAVEDLGESSARPHPTRVPRPGAVNDRDDTNRV